MKLICYLSNGYPDIPSSIRMARHYAEAGCDIIEVDFPSRDPYLEGEYIAGRMKRALEACGDYSAYMDGILQIKRENLDTRFIVLAYENTVEELGVRQYADFLLENGFQDIIYVGADHEEIKEYLIGRGIRVSCYVQYHMPEEEIEAARRANGFVYIQAKPTAGNVNPACPTLKDCIRRLREAGIEREIYAGVGIATGEDVAMAREAGADAVFVGSRILKLQEDIPAMKAAIAELKAAAE
ncbi:MAG: tryptophan synthase subunit alpha [Clostridiales bacterium]|nr:tryptophan synthase subunit alpha [Clostridiales bacterium]